MTKQRTIDAMKAMSSVKDVANVVIGTPPVQHGVSTARSMCPFCKFEDVRAFSTDSASYLAMSQEDQQRMLRAMVDGITIYECGTCAKRWAVQKMTQAQYEAKVADQEDQKMKNRGMNRQARRRVHAAARRLK